MSGKRETGPSPTQVDVLVVTAVKLEYDEVLKVEAGAWPGSTWEVLPTPTGLDAAIRTFQRMDGRPLRVAVARSLGMGEREATNAAVPLIKLYMPRCLAMSGVCAGRRGEVELGDVIIADRLWTYDTGQHVVEKDEASGQEVERVKGDMLTYNLKPRWLHAAESFSPPADSPWLAERPISYEAQMDWVLAQRVKEEDPSQHPDSQQRCPNWHAVMGLLWKKKWLHDGTLELTEEGRQHIEQQLLQHRKTLPEPKPFKVHVAPIGSGSKVEKDPKIFEKLSHSMRKVLGLEMEAAAIGAMARLQEVPDMIVMKAVMDFGDSEKSDHFKKFAARASAECLIAFLRKNFVERDPDEFKDLLPPGTSDPPKYSNPSALLTARHEIVPFYEEGRSELLEDLRQWCEDVGKPLSLRLFHGAGGMGKTRLFIEWSRRLKKKDWLAGFLVESPDPSRFERLLRSGRPTLIIIDYAESRQHLKELLEGIVRHRATGGGGLVRVALLARSVGDWWRSLHEGTGPLTHLLKERRPTEIGALAQSPEERARLFLAAAEHFADRLKISPPKQSHPDLTDQLFNRALYILMAALATVQGWPVRTKVLMKEVLRHEARFWQSHVQHLRIGDSEWRFYSRKIWRAVAALTLRGGVPTESDARKLLAQVNDSPDEWLIALLRDLYPGARPGTYVNGMEPDLLGETSVLYMLRRPGAGANEFLSQVFKDDERQAVRAGLEVLGRLSVKHPRASSYWIDQVLMQNPATRAVAALEAAKAVGEKTAYSSLGSRLARVLQEHGTAEIAKQLEAIGLPARTVSLREVAVWVMKTLLHDLSRERAYTLADDPRLQSQQTGAWKRFLRNLAGWVSCARGRPAVDPHHLAERARLLDNLGNRQSELGQRQEALEATKEAVSIRRRLSEAHPETFLLDLASSLNNLGIRQSELGQRQEALEATRESAGLYRRLSEAHPEALLPYLATSLNNLGNRQRELGQRQEALEATKEAAGLYRRLSEAHPEAFLPELATSLNNLGGMQSELGQRQEALEATKEAVSIRRRLSEAHPEAFLPELATSLNNLGGMQSELGQRQEALETTKEAAGLYRRLSEAHPEAFLPDLAASLNNLGIMQSKLGQRQEALEATKEAAGLYRRLSEAHPEAFLPDLAMSLNNLGGRQSELGQRQEALEATKEAVSIRRRLSEAHPEAFLPALAMSLNNLGNRQSELGQRQEALEATKEAVSIRRRLSEVHPEAFLPALATSLNNLGNRQRELGQRQEALEATKEAAGLYRRLSEAHPEAFLPELATSLSNLGGIQSERGQRQEALEATKEAVSIRRRLSEAHPEAFLPALASSLNNLGIRQSELGQRQEALETTKEAAGLCRRLSEAHPEAFLPDLAASLNNLGIMQSKLGQRQEALEAAKEAAGLYRRLSEAHPEAFLPELAMSLNNLGGRQSELGQRQEALEAAKEAAGLYRRLSEAHPEAFLPELAMSLNNLGNRQSELGLDEDALLSSQEAFAMIWPFFERLPSAFAPSTGLLLKNVVARMERIGRQPSQQLLERLSLITAHIQEITSETGSER